MREQKGTEAGGRPIPTCPQRCSWRSVRQAAARRLRASDGGQALPLALLVMGVGVILLSVLVLAVGVHMRLSSAEVSDMLAYYAADAGIERAIAPLAADPLAYPAASSLSLNLNNRSVSITITPAGQQVIPDPGGGLTTTISFYRATAQSGEIVITALAEARQVAAQPGATVRVTAWTIGR